MDTERKISQNKRDYGCYMGGNVYLCVMAHKIMRTMTSPLTLLGKWLLGFVVPDTCYMCGRPLRGDEKAICAHCLIDLPRTMLHYMQDDAVLNGLATQVPVGRSAAWVHYEKGTKVAHLILTMKFGNRPMLGAEMGRIFARELMPTGFFGGMDVIIPIPLHWSRLYRRGYNQTEFIARGVSSVTGLPIDTSLRAVRRHPAQARKDAEQRKANLAGTMEYLGDEGALSGRHVLLIDDIVTTGATMREAVRALVEDSGVGRVSILSLGRAHSIND